MTTPLTPKQIAYANELMNGPLRDLLRSCGELAQVHGLSSLEEDQTVLGIVLGIAFGAAHGLGVATPDEFAGLAHYFATHQSSTVEGMEDVDFADGVQINAHGVQADFHADGSIEITAEPEETRH